MPQEKIRFKPAELFWIAILALILILIFLPGPQKIGVENPAPAANNPALVQQKISVVGQNPPYVVDVEYPELTGLADSGILAEVNQDISSGINGMVGSFKNGGLGQPIADLPNAQNNLTGRYTVSYVSPYILSFEEDSSAYMIGDAHPDEQADTYNYDLRSGKRLALADLFLPGANYLQILSAYAVPNLASQLGITSEGPSLDLIRSGAAPTAANYQDFLIGQDGLIIVFAKYQVAPGAAGILRVTVPYSLLNKVMDPAGILGARLAG